jgi:hypothetical protein
MATSDHSGGREGRAHPDGSCSCCGGSGVLRTEAAGYRTCLECLGQGRKPQFETVLRLPSALSASTSGAR